MQRCPKCQSLDIDRSHTRSLWETWRKVITRNRPHRCLGCRWRGWGEESGPRFTAAEIERAESALAPDPPDLLQSDLPNGDHRRHLEIDLGALDILGPIPKSHE
jgi:hypothetical protein